MPPARRPSPVTMPYYHQPCYKPPPSVPCWQQYWVQPPFVLPPPVAQTESQGRRKPDDPKRLNQIQTVAGPEISIRKSQSSPPSPPHRSEQVQTSASATSVDMPREKASETKLPVPTVVPAEDLPIKANRKAAGYDLSQYSPRAIRGDEVSCKVQGPKPYLKRQSKRMEPTRVNWKVQRKIDCWGDGISRTGGGDHRRNTQLKIVGIHRAHS